MIDVEEEILKIYEGREETILPRKKALDFLETITGKLQDLAYRVQRERNKAISDAHRAWNIQDPRIRKITDLLSPVPAPCPCASAYRFICHCEKNIPDETFFRWQERHEITCDVLAIVEGTE